MSESLNQLLDRVDLDATTPNVVTKINPVIKGMTEVQLKKIYLLYGKQPAGIKAKAGVSAVKFTNDFGNIVIKKNPSEGELSPRVFMAQVAATAEERRLDILNPLAESLGLKKKHPVYRLCVDGFYLLREIGAYQKTVIMTYAVLVDAYNQINDMRVSPIMDTFTSDVGRKTITVGEKHTTIAEELVEHASKYACDRAQPQNKVDVEAVKRAIAGILK